MRRAALGAALAALLFAPAALAASLPGLQTGKAPWTPGWGDLGRRLDAIHLPQLQAEGTVVHIHQHLDVFIDGHAVRVPAYIGFGVEVDGKAHFIAELHTHDPSGVIHVESPRGTSFTLGQFFDVWGVRLTATCLGGYCNAGKSIVRVWANGKRRLGDPRTLPLTSHEEILVSFGTDRQLPAKIPPSYPFAHGV